MGEGSTHTDTHMHKQACTDIDSFRYYTSHAAKENEGGRPSCSCPVRGTMPGQCTPRDPGHRVLLPQRAGSRTEGRRGEQTVPCGIRLARLGLHALGRQQVGEESAEIDVWAAEGFGGDRVEG